MQPKLKPLVVALVIGTMTVGLWHLYSKKTDADSARHSHKAVVLSDCKNYAVKFDPKYKEHIKYKVSPNMFCAPEAKDLYWNVDKNVVVRSVYPEKRNWNGHPSSYVFFIEIDRNILSDGAHVQCQVGSQRTSSLDWHLMVGTAKADAWCHLTHLQVVVHCYLPLLSGNNSRASLSYMVGPGTLMLVAESEKPLRIPDPHVKGYEITIISCLAVQYGQPPFLAEWVRYQKTIGINHIHMLAEESIHTSGALDNPSEKKAIEEGYLSIDIWYKWFSAAQMFDHSQQIAYQSCLYRYQGTYDWLYTNDADDFFVPMETGHKALKFYIQTYCRHAGTCSFPWYQMCPTCGVFGEAGVDGNVTDTLVSFDRCRREALKSVHNIPVTFEISTHTGDKWTEGYGTQWVEPGHAYVAHIRI